jgi:acyl carrier protein
MTEREILEQTRKFVTDSFLYMRPGFVLADNDKLMEKGVVDSMGVMELMEFLTSEFEVTLADDEITEANLGTLASIAGYVARKRGAATA